MEIWLDTTDIPTIKKAKRLGILHGVTTNPSIVAHSKKGLEELLKALLETQDGPVAVQVTLPSGEEMVGQGEAIAQFSPRFIVKVPVTAEGLFAIHTLSAKKIPVMATAVFDPNQCILAARAGALYIAPYYSHICDEELEGYETFCKMVKLLERHGYSSKILAAALRTTEQVRECASIGVDAVTMNEKIFEEYIADHPSTIKALSRFDLDWNTDSVAPNFLKAKGRGEEK
jgi:transaldolase